MQVRKRTSVQIQEKKTAKGIRVGAKLMYVCLNVLMTLINGFLVGTSVT